MIFKNEIMTLVEAGFKVGEPDDFTLGVNVMSYSDEQGVDFIDVVFGVILFSLVLKFARVKK